MVPPPPLSRPRKTNPEQPLGLDLTLLTVSDRSSFYDIFMVKREKPINSTVKEDDRPSRHFFNKINAGAPLLRKHNNR